MKKTNKGFSMVELIIVIAIMAILAGALAPALIKYINKSRISSDIQTAQTIATAVQTALSNETGYDEAASLGSSYNSLSIVCSTGSVFGSLVTDTLGGSVPTVKSKKCMAKNASSNTYSGANFEVKISGNDVIVREGTKGHVFYPSTTSCLTNEDAACGASLN